MATASHRLPDNVDGDFFVDATCIDCDACRQIAPRTFRESSGRSAVFHQPATAAELLDAQKALLSCPTASIGSEVRHPMEQALSAYPERIDGDVWRCGFTSEKSFGAFSYLVTAPEGNLLVDSPRFSGPIVRNIESLGGVRMMLLTHSDDVADHDRFHRHFSCDRVLHSADARGLEGRMEFQPSGKDPIEISPAMLMIPTPGHTRGHVVYLYRERFLFSGDHLSWDERRGRLYAFRSVCWYSWPEQIESMERLLDYPFEWVLPGHGRPVHLPAPAMGQALERCVEWMKQRS